MIRTTLAALALAAALGLAVLLCPAAFADGLAGEAGAPLVQLAGVDEKQAKQERKQERKAAKQERKRDKREHKAELRDAKREHRADEKEARHEKRMDRKEAKHDRKQTRREAKRERKARKWGLDADPAPASPSD